MRCLTTVLLVLVCGASAAGQATLFLENPDAPGTGELTLSVGETAVIQLWLEWADPGDGSLHHLVGIDAFLDYRIAGGGGAKGAGVEATEFADLGPWGGTTRPLYRAQRPTIDEDNDGLPDAGDSRHVGAGNLEYYGFAAGADAPNPGDIDSGLPAGWVGPDGAGAYLLDEIVVRGVAESDDRLFFETGLTAPEGFQSVGDPETETFGSWEEVEITLGKGASDNRFGITVLPAEGGEGARSRPTPTVTA